MSNIDNALNQLIEAIKQSDVYGEYVAQLERVKQQPELKNQIDDFRARKFELQYNGEDTFSKSEQFEREYEEFLGNPLVSDFLSAEVAFCRMIQRLNCAITEAVQFE